MATRSSCGRGGGGAGLKCGTLCGDWVLVPSCLIGDTVTNIDTKDRLVMQCPLQSHLLLPAACRQPGDVTKDLKVCHFTQSLCFEE